MSAARVVNPFSLNEMRRLREAVRCPVMPDPEARAKVCRNLYGRASAEDTRAFVTRELAIQRERASERWGFDFLRECPRGVSDRYVWSRVKPGGVPAAYALRRMACIGGTLAVNISSTPLTPLAATPSTAQQPEMETASTTVTITRREQPALAQSPITTMTVANIVDRTPSPVAAVAPSQSVKRQAQITEFMKCRKRPSTSSGKEANPSTKRARLCST